MKTAIFNNQLIDVCIYNIYLIKSDVWISAMYRGATLIGLMYDFEKVTSQELTNVIEEVVPKDINNVDKFKEKYKNRIEYGKSNSKEEYFFLSDSEYYQSFVLNRNIA